MAVGGGCITSTYTKSGKSDPADLRVSDLIDGDGRWDDNILTSLFMIQNANLIREIPLSARKPCDLQYWWPTRDGMYFTKSGYWLGRLGHLRGWAL